jgi:hypothetical protein
MDWIKQNKFLAGWLAVTLLGAAALGYLFFSAKSQYSETWDSYTAKVGELQNLQNATPYPDEENLKKMQELQKAHQAAINDLQKQLAKNEIPVTPLTAVKFQDELRESVKRVTALAAENNTKLPDKFYMAFDRYQAEPPKDEAAAPLGRLLKAMEEAITILIKSRADVITDFKRDPIPEEGGEKPATASGTPKPAGGKTSEADAESALVKRQPVSVSFVASEGRFRRFINELISSKKQFYIPKNLVVTNEKTTGVPKIAAAAPPVPGEDPSKSGGLKYVVGDERLTVSVRVDIADFADVGETKPSK